MPTLAQVRSRSRQFLTITVLFIVGIFILMYIVNYIKALNPPPPVPPTVSFGKLPVIAFPQNVTTAKLQFNLNTISGNLPAFGDRATIYDMQQTQPSLLALGSATTLANNMGYTGNSTQISDSEYQWTNTDDIPKTLLLNIFSNNFTISSPYQSSQDILQANNLPDQNSAISTVTSFLQSANILPTDINTSKTKATLLSITNGQLTPATSLSNTQIIQVDLFQNDMHGLPIFYPNPTHSTMTFYVGGGSTQAQIVQASFYHQSIGQDNATYPIISAQEAFNALKNGQGYIAFYDGSSTTISIHNVVLGYYMSDNPQKFLMPIIVFEGDSGFFAYVPAVKGEWLHN